MSMRVVQLELVASAIGYVRYEQFPNAAFAAQIHRVAPAVPIVEIADDADASGIRCPDGKRNACHAAMHHRVRAQDVGDSFMRALGEEIRIDLAQDRNVRGCRAYGSNLRASVGNASEYVGCMCTDRSSVRHVL